MESRRSTARDLRLKGLSIKAIAKMIHASQSSVSVWVRGVPLTEQQKQILRSKMHSPDSIAKRRQKRLENELLKRTKVTDHAQAQVKKISSRELWLVGTALYWAEGTKKHRTVQFSNGDPEMIKLMLKYFREICQVPEYKIRAYIHIHHHLDTKRAERHWQNVTKISPSQFYKTYNIKNKSSQGKRSSLPNGVCDIYVLDTKLYLKIMGWINGIHTRSIASKGVYEYTPLGADERT